MAVKQAVVVVVAGCLGSADKTGKGEAGQQGEKGGEGTKEGGRTT